MSRLSAEIGSWFEDIESGQLFEVVALDELHNTIEIQYLDGSLDGLDGETWGQMALVPAAAPEDANAAYELGSEEESPDNGPAPGSGNPLDRLEQFDSGSFTGTDETY